MTAQRANAKTPRASAHPHMHACSRASPVPGNRRYGHPRCMPARAPEGRATSRLTHLCIHTSAPLCHGDFGGDFGTFHLCKKYTHSWSHSWSATARGMRRRGFSFNAKAQRGRDAKMLMSLHDTRRRGARRRGVRRRSDEACGMQCVGSCHRTPGMGLARFHSCMRCVHSWSYA